MTRLQLLENWVQSQFPDTPLTLAPASEDASFRRYFRVTLPEKSMIVMDAPPQHEDCRPFIRVAKLFQAAGVNVPDIYAQDLSLGFLLLKDLGHTTYLQVLQHDNAKQLYLDAIDALINIQLVSKSDTLPEYDRARLLFEMNLFPDWYIAKHLQTTLSESEQSVLEQTFERLIENNLAQPQVYVHRDYHSRNLMVTEPNPGILDFQDALYGPITYDLVSLFKDAYISWDEELILDWLIRYWEKAKKVGLPVNEDFAIFYRDFEWMGIQRHLKVLGIFARLYHRDGKSGYLKDMPLVSNYLRKACERYSEFSPLLKLLDKLEGKSQINVGYTF